VYIFFIHVSNNSAKLSTGICEEITKTTNCGNQAAKGGKEKMNGNRSIPGMKFT